MNIKTKSNFPKVQNLSYENEFYFYENKKRKIFSNQKLRTWPLFETEAWVNSGIAYLRPGLQSYPEFYLLVKKKTNHKDDNK